MITMNKLLEILNLEDFEVYKMKKIERHKVDSEIYSKLYFGKGFKCLNEIKRDYEKYFNYHKDRAHGKTTKMIVEAILETLNAQDDIKIYLIFDNRSFAERCEKIIIKYSKLISDAGYDIKKLNQLICYDWQYILHNSNLIFLGQKDKVYIRYDHYLFDKIKLYK